VRRHTMTDNTIDTLVSPATSKHTTSKSLWVVRLFLNLEST